MAQRTINELKAFFEAGDRPTESQFKDLIDSYLHLSDPRLEKLIENIDIENGYIKLKSDAGVLVTQVSLDHFGNKLTESNIFINTLQNQLPPAPVQSVNGQTGVVTIASSKANWLDFSGRFYMNTNNRWVGSSVNFGQATENYNHNHGTGANPSVIWNSLGIGFLPKDTIIHSMEFIGRVNNLEVTDIQVHLSCQGNNLNEGIGYDSVAESQNQVILPSTNLGNNAPNFYDMQRHVIPLGDFVLDRDRIIEFCCRPIGTLTGTRYWMAQRYLHFTLP